MKIYQQNISSPVFQVADNGFVLEINPADGWLTVYDQNGRTIGTAHSAGFLPPAVPSQINVPVFLVAENDPELLKLFEGGETSAMAELPWGIYNKYTEEWWKQTNEDKPMVFPTAQAARNFLDRLEKEDGQHCDEDEAFITQTIHPIMSMSPN